jgi:hypothetical protein
MNRQQTMKLAALASRGKTGEIASTLRAIPFDSNHRTWGYNAHKFADWLDGKREGTPYAIFAEGNSKLPFFAFSALPFVTCPGMGDCSKWCYSLKAWRYPAAFFRQLQNTLLVATRPELLRIAFLSLPKDSTARLYVDGDFDSLKTLEFWMGTIALRPDLNVYGYSKSWHLFLSYAKANAFPANYTLNLSGGSRFSALPDMVAQMKALPIVRGEFVAVKVSSRAPEGHTREFQTYAAEVRAAAKEQGHKAVWVCPGKCGECTARGHACGLENFRGVTIAIGLH